MNAAEHSQQIQDLFYKLKFGKLLLPITPLSGGLLHLMFGVQAEHGTYAVKVLNPQVMAHPDAVKNTVHSEQIAAVAADYLPASCAKIVDQQALQDMNGQYYLIYDFIQGKSIDFPNITPLHCQHMGDCLANLHGIDFSFLEIKDSFASHRPSVDWSEYLRQGQKANSSWVDLLKSNLSSLVQWDKKAIASEQGFSTGKIITHRDLDPKNVLWQDETPIIIDWESAGYLHPSCDFVETALYWSMDAAGQLNEDCLLAFAGAYYKKLPRLPQGVSAALDYGFSGKLGWLAYNLRRSLGLETVDQHDQEIGTAQVLGTIANLGYYAEQVPFLAKKLTEQFAAFQLGR